MYTCPLEYTSTGVLGRTKGPTDCYNNSANCVNMLGASSARLHDCILDMDGYLSPNRLPCSVLSRDSTLLDGAANHKIMSLWWNARGHPILPWPWASPKLINTWPRYSYCMNIHCKCIGGYCAKGDIIHVCKNVINEDCARFSRFDIRFS